MGDGEELDGNVMRRIQTEFDAAQSSSVLQRYSSSHVDLPQQSLVFARSFSQTFTARATSQMPPVSPYSLVPSSKPANQNFGVQNFSSAQTHSRSLSQPSSGFCFDLLPPLSPASFRDAPVDVSMEDKQQSSSCNKANFSPRVNGALPPRKAHRRSASDIPPGAFGVEILGKPATLVKRKSENSNPEGKANGEGIDDLFSAYMNLENFDTINSSGTDDKTDSRASGTKTNGFESSDNEAESCVEAESVVKRTRHCRSVSIDSFVGDQFNVDFGSDEFSGAELKKIMANDKLAEIALTDPKRARRILANRQSAARSKERKMRYISELEHKVQTLQTEATNLSAQLTLLQRDSVGLTNQNSELKFRLQAMEQQAQLRDALNDALTAEVRRLKLATAEMGQNSDPSKSMIKQQISNAPMYYQMQPQDNVVGHHHHQQQKIATSD